VTTFADYGIECLKQIIAMPEQSARRPAPIPRQSR